MPVYKNEGLTTGSDPQDVYNYEFGNHVCSYTCNDEEAIKIVVDYFGKERAKNVKRRFDYFEF